MGEERKMKNKAGYLVCLVVGVLFLLAGLGVMALAVLGNKPGDKEPVDVYEVMKEEEYCYTPIQYMTESIAAYEANDKVQFYIAIDTDGNPSIICIQDKDMAEYQPYIDWLYSESEEGEPEVIYASGYSVRVDDELKGFVIEAMNGLFGENSMAEEDFYDMFGEYYVNVGVRSGTYAITNVGFVLILLGLFMAVLPAVKLSGRAKTKEAEKNPYYAEVGPDEEKRGLGILGAIGGAVLGGILWAVIGAMGFVSGWIGILVIYFSVTGYRIFARKTSRFGNVTGIICGLLIILPATYASAAWNYYEIINENVSGYMNFFEVLVRLPEYLTRYDEWNILIQNAAMGYVFAGVAAAYFLFALKGRRIQDKKKSLEQAAQWNNVQTTEQNGAQAETQVPGQTEQPGQTEKSAQSEQPGQSGQDAGSSETGNDGQIGGKI